MASKSEWKGAVEADFESHHIEGYAHAALEAGKDGNFSVPLISHVTGNLWQGGCIGGVDLPEDFDYVVSLYPWEKYNLGPNTARMEVKLFDSAEMPDERLIYDVARMVNAFRAHGKTLVHCQAGLNRSGLIAALALIVDGTLSPREAIELLRHSRSPVVLCNETFEKWLLAQASTQNQTEGTVVTVTILVCGSREWRDRGAVRLALMCEPGVQGWSGQKIRVIHGGARGADALAGETAAELGYTTEVFPADWDRHGLAAGPIRNRRMLDQRPDLVMAFGNGRGTSDTVNEAEKRGIPVRRFGYVPDSALGGTQGRRRDA